MPETSRGWKHAPNAECESTRPAAFIRIEIVSTIVLAFLCNALKIFKENLFAVFILFYKYATNYSQDRRQFIS